MELRPVRRQEAWSSEVRRKGIELVDGYEGSADQSGSIQGEERMQCELAERDVFFVDSGSSVLVDRQSFGIQQVKISANKAGSGLVVVMKDAVALHISGSRVRRPSGVVYYFGLCL